MQFASPQIVNLLIAFVQNDEPTWRGYFYTVLICGATFMCTIFNSQCFYQGALHLTMKYLAILLVEGLRFPKYIPSLFKVLDMEFFKFEKKRAAMMGRLFPKKLGCIDDNSINCMH